MKLDQKFLLQTRQRLQTGPDFSAPPFRPRDWVDRPSSPRHDNGSFGLSQTDSSGRSRPRNEIGLRAHRERRRRRPIASAAAERDLAAAPTRQRRVASLTARDVPRASANLLQKPVTRRSLLRLAPPPLVARRMPLSHGESDGRASTHDRSTRIAVPEGLPAALIARYFSSRWRR